MDLPDEKTSDERRQYFRIKNSLFMSYELYDDGTDELEQAPKEIDAKSLRSMHLLKELNSILEENENYSKKLPSLDSKTKNYLESLDTKIIEITKYLVKTLGVEYSELLEVDLSGGGIRFRSEKSEPIDQKLKLDLVLVPEYYNLTAYGTVVDCRKLEHAEEFELAISFTDIQEADRDAVIRHVFKRQSKQLRLDKQA
ncbi:MAG: PilZ domain-containing protein [Kangiellaceae bacterium]|nr:PilZ domain-containing protein [Kangiellaceae bacterium]